MVLAIQSSRLSRAGVLMMTFAVISGTALAFDDNGGSFSRLPTTEGGRVPYVSAADAWKKLPKSSTGTGEPLPGWARALALTLPQTTASMLELDYLHRARGPLPAVLRAQLRWVAARANHCPYAQSYAEADMRELGLGEDAIRALGGDPSALTAELREAVNFARKLSLSADAITDAEVARLIERYGERQFVAMVLLLAHASFQDRLLTALAIPVESGGPLRPLEVHFALRPSPAPRPPLATDEKKSTNVSPNAGTFFASIAFSDLQLGLEQRKTRQSRIRVPEDNSWQVSWSKVCHNYQPDLAGAWLASVHAFTIEADHDPIFDESLFWVVTHSQRCYYCMGHTQMRLEVDGMSREGVMDRCRRLASGDWACFSPREQAAYAFARKQAEKPASITARDWEELVERFGIERALDVVWWSSRCNYMTRVADAFQLPLEQENVFDGFLSRKEAPKKP